MVDFSPDTFRKSIELGVELAKVKYLLFTHTHSDHFYLNDLKFRYPPFVKHNLQTLQIYGSEYAIKLVRKTFKGSARKCRIRSKALKLFEEHKIGRYKVIPVKAKHITNSPVETPLNYIIDVNGKTILLAFDTGLYDEGTWSFLRKFSFDLAIVEGTLCYDSWEYHMNFNDLKIFRRRVGAEEIIVTHFSHHSCPLHDKLEKILEAI